jgi:hypothetical protein
MRPTARLSHLPAEMRIKDIDPVIEDLLDAWPRGFRTKQLAGALGVSSGRASQLLAPRIMSRELARAGERRGLYIRGPDWGKEFGAVARGADPASFWKALVKDCPRLAYVALSGLGFSQLRTRGQVRMALRHLSYGRPFLIVDFQGVHSISESASDELFVKVPRTEAILVEPINLDPAIARTISHVLRCGG